MLLERTVVVRVRDGLHARPATQFVKLAKSFRSDVELRRGERGANAKSSVKLMLLGVKEEDEILLRVEGEDAAEALDQLAAFITSPEAGLDVALAAPGGAPEPTAGAAASAEPAPSMPPAAAFAAPIEGAVAGVPASEGLALGPAFHFFPEPIAAEPRPIAPDAVEDEVARYRAALGRVAAVLGAARTNPALGPSDVQIVEALIEVAADTDFTAEVTRRIGEGVDAVTAALGAGAEIAADFAALDDPYLRARAEDVRSVTRQLALALLGRQDVSLADLPAGSILVADEIGAFDLAKAPLGAIAGILCRTGAATSHVAILARAHGVPAVLGFDAPVERLKAAGTVGLDGRTGRVWLDPDAETVATIRAGLAAEAAERRALDGYRALRPTTRAGVAIEIAANLGSLKEIEAAKAAGAMGVGLFRTEFLFMERKTLPGEDEQAAVYAELARAFSPDPVIIRTLDVGGDKPVAGIDFPHEDNPFLGWRGVRMCLDRPEVFKPQLRALLRAATAGSVKVMVPMIAHAGELRAVKDLLAECRAELEAAGVPVGPVELGVMMETPAAAFLADELAAEAAFFSIGTNDLTQYVMAADRLNPRVAALNRADHPAVLKAVEMICAAAKAAGIPVGVCGEAAARPDLIPTFVDLGVTELSMSPASIPRAKKVVTEI